MGKPTVAGLTAQQAAFVGYKLLHTEKYGKLPPDYVAAQVAGYSDPIANATRIAASPRVKRAILDALSDINCNEERVARVFDRNLDAAKPSDQLRAAEDIAKLRGEFSSDDRNAPAAVTLNIVNFVFSGSPAAENGS